MSRNKNNQSAVELWEQVFSTLAKQPNASLVAPDYDPAEDEQRLRQGLKEAGWSDEFIETSIRLKDERTAIAPVTSPGVNPDVEIHLQRLSADIEAAMGRLGLKSHAHVARGVEPRLGPHAAKIGVIMTDESIVTVGSHLFRFCGLVARAVTRTIHLNPYIWDSPEWDERSAQKLLLSSSELMKYWMRIYLSYAVTGTHFLVPFKPSQKHELILFEQIARAMELFAVGHEYGHHHHAHGRVMEADAQSEEFEADQFALKVCYEIERFPVIAVNPYLSSGAGGAVLLLALEQLRLVQSLIEGKSVRADSHPPALARIQRMDSVALMKPAEFNALKNFRVAMTRLMSVVNALLSQGLPVAALKEFAETRRAIFEAHEA